MEKNELFTTLTLMISGCSATKSKTNKGKK